MKKKKIKGRIARRKKKRMLKYLILFSIIIMGYSSIKIFLWTKDNYNINKEIEQLQKQVLKIETTNNDNQEEKKIENQEKSFNPYWDFTEEDYLQIDFSKLIEQNKETVAWIKVEKTNINYPIVQHKDNEYYLNHSFNKTENNAGWVFMDYRNNIQNMGKNTIIYAHGRQDGTMFGSLKNSLKSKWYKDKNNHIIKLETKEENTLWQVFSIYVIPTTNDYIQTQFETEEDFEKFINKITERSIYNFRNNVNKEDKILTLSTCYNEKEKLVLHAKQIKVEKR